MGALHLKGPFLCFIVLAAAGLFMIWRQMRRWLRDEHRWASNPRESRLSSLSGLAIGILLAGLAGSTLAFIAGLSRYLPFDSAAGPPTLSVVLEPAGDELRLALRGLPVSPVVSPVLEKGWFSIAAQKVTWRGPLRWAGFGDSIRPCAVLTARSRNDLSDASRIGRISIAPGSLFESLLGGPASGLGLWTFEEIRTPWRPARAGSLVCLFTEGGAALVSP